MPSFSFLKSPKRGSPESNDNAGGFDGDVDRIVDNEHENKTAEKEQRRHSKRDYFRNLLKRSSLNSESKSSRRTSGRSSMSHSSHLHSLKSPPMSPVNKPLPPPPSGSELEPSPVKPPAKAPIKLDRIISPLSFTDLQSIFSGAPQFFARSEGHHTGAPHPSVAYPWDQELSIRDLGDHIQIQDEAWGSVTAWPHVTYQVSKNPEASEKHYEKQRAHFLPRCRERPNMLSMQGIERGTIGYQAALEMGVADALQVPSDESAESISDHRKTFLNGKDGLRPVTDSTLIDRLIAVSEVYHEDPLKNQRPTVQLYTELFTQILFPPSRVTDLEDPYSLQVQIESLVNVLAAPIVWVDFGMVEWRIRLGQIIWGVAGDMEQDDEIAVNNEVMHESGTEKYWLLLQILLGCELLVRLDTLSVNIAQGGQPARPSDIARFEKDATLQVKWSLILARAWLENIRVEKAIPEAAAEKKSAGWLTTLTGTSGVEAKVNGAFSNSNFHGRHQARQLSGLLNFARKLDWPNLENLKSKVAPDGITISDSIQSTPVETPLTMSTQRTSSYFAAKRPSMRRALSQHKNISAIIHPAGWLSNSFISGLILPGEGMSHLLMSTVLENDPIAIAKLGDEMNLYGGFILGDQSFWSTSCLVGRILAARKGASECMGWVSSDVLPRGVREGWVDIEADMNIQDPNKKSNKARLWHKQAIEHDGNVIGGADSTSILPGDFILPSDESTQPPLLVHLESLDLFVADSATTEPTREEPTPLTDASETSKIETYSALMRFSVQSGKLDRREINVSLTYDVQFVTAHPCIPSPHLDVLKTPTSPPFQTSEHLHPGSPAPFIGHPLHKAFTYTKITLSALLATPPSTTFSALLSTPPPASPTPSGLTHSTIHTTSSTIQKVLIVDCTDITMTDFPTRPTTTPHSKTGRKAYGSEVELLIRAVCAERGWNALISRRGRGCLACAVREAGALEWRVVVRIA